MANQRAEDQQLLPFTAKRKFVAELDAGLQQINVSNRSQFIRDAILEKLEREGIRIPRNLASAPARTQPIPNKLMVETGTRGEIRRVSAINSKPPSLATAVADAASAKVKREKSSHGH
jgi:hypothetical protein